MNAFDCYQIHTYCFKIQCSSLAIFLRRNADHWDGDTSFRRPFWANDSSWSVVNTPTTSSFTIPYHYTTLQIQSNSLLVPQQRRCLKQVGIIVNPLALCPLSLIHHRERLDRTTATITTCHTTAAVGTTIKLVMLQLLEAP